MKMMVNVKKRTYIIGFIILGLVILGSAIIAWNLISNYDKQQDKVYSGAKLVYIRSQYSFWGGGFGR
mgnify:CR=1 FL=1